MAGNAVPDLEEARVGLIISTRIGEELSDSVRDVT